MHDLLLFSCSVRLFVTLWTAACHAPLAMGFPRQEYWRRLPFPSPDLPNWRIKPASPALQADSLPLNHLGILLDGWLYQFYFLFSNLNFFFPSWLYWSELPILSKSGKGRSPCIVPNLREKACHLSSVDIRLFHVLCRYLLSDWRNILAFQVCWVF